MGDHVIMEVHGPDCGVCEAHDACRHVPRLCWRAHERVVCDEVREVQAACVVTSQGRRRRRREQLMAIEASARALWVARTRVHGNGEGVPSYFRRE